MGCTPENQARFPSNSKAFNPNEIPGCVNAWGPEKDIILQNLISPSTEDPKTLCLIFKVRARSRYDQIKALVQGQDQSTSKGSRRTKERKIGEVI